MVRVQLFFSFFFCRDQQIVFWGSKTALFKNLGEKRNAPFFGQFCDHRPILGIRSQIRALYNTRKWMFQGGSKTTPLNNLGKKSTHFFCENCVITGQYQEYILRPEVSTTPGSRCFATSLTYIQTDIARLNRPSGPIQ